MAAYVVAQMNVTDPEGFERYRDAVAPMVARFGGKYLVRGGATECLEGTWPSSRMVIIAFESMESAKTFYNSEDYQKILPYRLNASEGVLILADGYEE